LLPRARIVGDYDTRRYSTIPFRLRSANKRPPLTPAGAEGDNKHRRSQAQRALTLARTFGLSLRFARHSTRVPCGGSSGTLRGSSRVTGCREARGIRSSVSLATLCDTLNTAEDGDGTRNDDDDPTSPAAIDDPSSRKRESLSLAPPPPPLNYTPGRFARREDALARGFLWFIPSTRGARGGYIYIPRPMYIYMHRATRGGKVTSDVFAEKPLHGSGPRRGAPARIHATSCYSAFPRPVRGEGGGQAGDATPEL